MLINLAWRNIWRNRRRSLVVLSSIIVGVVALVLMDGLTNGMMYQMLYNQINTSVGHIQINRKGYNDDPEIKKMLQDKMFVMKTLDTLQGVEAYSQRVKTFGLISSAYSSAGVYITGVDAEKEPLITNMKNLVREGRYLSGSRREIVISKATAEKLSVKLGSKIVLYASSTEGKPEQELFRIVGLYESFSSEFDKTNLFINISDAQNFLSLGGNVSQIVIKTKNTQQVKATDRIIEAALGKNYEVLNYGELLPLVILQIDMTQESMKVLNVIIALALIFGIVNTMLMSVFERVNEFGVLMAIGLKTRNLFTMVVSEAFFLGALGTIVGLTVGAIIIIPLSYTGIDFSIFSESLKSFGVGSMVYPQITAESILTTIFTVPVISIIGAIYPAYKASSFEPVYAIRYV